MRGSDQRSGELFSYVDIEARLPMRHPLRAIRSIVNQGLASLDGEFDKLYADTGRDSIPPERLLRAALLDPFRAPADGAAQLQPALPLVRGAGGGRCRVGPLGVLQEPRPAAGGRRGGHAPGAGARTPAREAPDVGPTLLGHWPSDGGEGT